MDTTCGKSVLKDALSKALSAANLEYNDDPTSWLLVEALEGWIQLTCSSPTHTIITSAPAETTKPGEALLNGKCLSDILGCGNQEQVRIRTDRGKIKIVLLGKPKLGFTIPSLAKSSVFPRESYQSPPHAILFDGSSLTHALNRTLGASGKFDIDMGSMTYAKGRFQARLEEDGSLRFTGTDGIRLATMAVSRFPQEVTAAAKPWNLVISSTSCKAMASFCKEAFVQVWQEEGKRLCLSHNNNFFSAQCLNGSFPPWEKIMPKDDTPSFDIPTSFVMGMAKAGSVASTQDQGTVITLSLDATTKILRARLDSERAIAMMEETIPSIQVNAEIRLQISPLLACARAIRNGQAGEDEVVKCFITDWKSPLFIVCQDGFTYLISPINKVPSVTVSTPTPIPTASPVPAQEPVLVPDYQNNHSLHSLVTASAAN